MFNGIIKDLGTVIRILWRNGGAELTVRVEKGSDDFNVGESIAVNGVCLTVKDCNEDTFIVDLSAETLSRTSFNDFEEGVFVNLERSLVLSDKIDGHFVSGHVDCVGEIISIEHKDSEVLFCFEHLGNFTPYIIEKGSVAVDGISLTAFSCSNNRFKVSIIPFTFSHTNLNTKKTKDKVNIECDMIGKYVYKACESILLSDGIAKRNPIERSQ